MRSTVRLAVVPVVATVSFLLGSPAWSDPTGPGDGNVTGSTVSSPDYEVPAAVKQQAAAKQALADAYYNAKYGTGSDAATASAARKYKAAYPSASEGNVAQLASQPASVMAAAASAQLAVVKLGVIHYAQEKNYYCGPAVGKMILNYKNEGASAYNGASLTQAHVGGPDHMRTDINGATSWSTGLFRIGMNKWRVGTEIGFYVDLSKPTPTEFKSNLVTDVDNGFPIAANTVELAGGVHYNGHPSNQKIGHWIVGQGYYNYGDGTYFLDPSTSVWSTASPSFTYATSTFTTRFMQYNGMTW